MPSAGFAFCHLSGILNSALWSNSYIIGRKLSSSKLPSTTLHAYSYKSSNIVPRCVPAVVIMISKGCVRADCDCFITSYKFLSWIECNSSITTRCAFNPSSELEFLPSDCILLKLCGKYKSLLRLRIFLFKSVLCLIISWAWSNSMLAWSRLDATEYTSEPLSPSAISMYSAIAASIVDLPDFLATKKNDSVYLLYPVSLSTKPNSADT